MARDPNRDFGPASNAYESPDFAHAWNDNRAAQDAVDPWERRPFSEDDWRTEDGDPRTADWAVDDRGLPNDYPQGPVSSWADQGQQYGDEEPEQRSGWFRGGWGW